VTPLPIAPLASSVVPDAFFNRELSWLNFASRVIALAEDSNIPLLERVRFVGIAGLLHDEFFMKRMSGLKRNSRRGSTALSLDGRLPSEELTACRAEILAQSERLARVLEEDLRPRMAEQGMPILSCSDLRPLQAEFVRQYLRESVRPILTPFAVDSEHPFPFVSNLGINLAVLLPDRNGGLRRFVRIEVPYNRPRWVPLPEGGWVPLEQVIAANLDLVSPSMVSEETHVFRVTRGAEGDADRIQDELRDEVDGIPAPGSIVRLVTDELKARRFAGVVRLQTDAAMPKKFRKWLEAQLDVDPADVYANEPLLGLCDLARLEAKGRDDLRFPPHEPVTHPRLRKLRTHREFFDEIKRGDLLLHHPYHRFDTSVLRLIESAAEDPDVLAIKLTIYRTSSDSPIVRALAEAARRGKQVVVLVEVTARFDEAPNIRWGQYLQKEGAHVAYGVRRLKTHVKLALVVREEGQQVRLYAHVGTGNYHTGTARLYEDVGVLTANREICDDVAAIFNSLTSATSPSDCRRLIVAPLRMRERFTDMIRREAAHARSGQPSGIVAKMNQLQDPDVIRELYRAGQAGVPIALHVRGLCCLRPGLPGLSENIRVFSVVGRFLEHSRIFRFTNGGEPEYYIGSADWMRRNLNSRVETILPILDGELQKELDQILGVYDADNCSVWECAADGTYRRRTPGVGEERRAAQDVFLAAARNELSIGDPPDGDGEVGDGADALSRPRSGLILPST
jgi:polyphosphate kinase